MSLDIYSYLDTLGDDYVGVDALTLTGKSSLSMIGVRGLLCELMSDYETEQKKPFKFHKASGFSVGPIRYASEADQYGRTKWAIVMVTGPGAARAIKWAGLDLTGTRLDLRVDVRMTQPVPDLAERLYKLNGKNGRYISSLTGQTYYPEDNRQSTFFGRIYDKSSEYGECLGVVWRFEVEIKRRAADAYLTRLRAMEDVEKFIETTTFGIFAEKWRVPTPRPGTVPKLNYVGLGAVSTEQKLDWLRRNVARTVTHLTRIGYEDELREMFSL